MVRSDQQAATEDPFGAVGFAVVTEQARAAGAGSLPAPISAEGSDAFFMYQHIYAGIRFGTAVGLAHEARVFEFDSRAMRKVETSDAIVMLIENASALHAMVYILKYRILIKLH